MNETLQTEVLDRLQRQIKLADKVSELVLADLMNEVEECLRGKAPTAKDDEANPEIG